MSKQYTITFMGTYDVIADSKEEAKAIFESEEINQTENIWISQIERSDKCDCTDCIKDGTDACPRGASRAVDDEICDEFIYAPYVMIYGKYQLPQGHELRKLQRYVNNRFIFWTIGSFKEYLSTN